VLETSSTELMKAVEEISKCSLSLSLSLCMHVCFGGEGVRFACCVSSSVHA
jgi:hypothetical protein